jgi:hypothetical protein
MANTTVTPTISERARKRATQSRLRAIYHAPHYGRQGTLVPAYYVVYNLTNHHKYTVSAHGNVWVCHCEGAKGGRRCQHVQRVLDREEKRTKQEALSDG